MIKFMVRVKRNTLTEKEGRCFYHGSPFTGIAFKMNDNLLEDASEFCDGREIGKYIFEHFSHFDTNLVLNEELLYPENEDDYQPFMCFCGKMFTGVALVFEGDFCTAEDLYIEGWSDSSIGYYPSGNIEAIEIIKNKISQTFLWYGNNQIRQFEISHRDIFSITLSFNEDGFISVLRIEGDYFNQVKLISDQLFCDLFTDDSFIDNLLAGDFLSLGGDFIDDHIFERLFMNDGLKNICKFFISGTNITERRISLLKDLPMLDNLSVASELINTEIMKEIKLAKGDCYIVFNKKEVRL